MAVVNDDGTLTRRRDVEMDWPPTVEQLLRALLAPGVKERIVQSWELSREASRGGLARATFTVEVVLGTGDLERQAANPRALTERIRRWREDDAAGYDQAIELLCEAEHALRWIGNGVAPAPAPPSNAPRQAGARDLAHIGGGDGGED